MSFNVNLSYMNKLIWVKERDTTLVAEKKPKEKEATSESEYEIESEGDISIIEMAKFMKKMMCKNMKFNKKDVKRIFGDLKKNEGW